MKGGKSIEQFLLTLLKEFINLILFPGVRQRSWRKKTKNAFRLFLLLLLLMPWIPVTRGSLNEAQSRFRSSSYRSTDQSSVRVSSPPARLSASYESHPPISIQGNQDFIGQATAGNWSGNGTSASPYIIAGFNITAPSNFDLVDIRNTDVFFRISNCLLLGGGDGISLQNASNGHISDNHISNTGRNGIFFWLSGNSTISGNSLAINSDRGIVLDDSSNTIISNNSITDHGGVGIWLETSWNSTIFGNTVTRNRRDGIVLESSWNSTIFGNNLSNNGDRGIWLESSSSTVISDNIVTFNDGTGIWLESSGRTIISGNNLSKNSEGGISLLLSENGTISDNIVNHNGGVGISLDFSGRSTISNNTIVNVEGGGISLASSGKNRIVNNHLMNDGLAVYGLTLDDFIQTEVVNNSTNGRPVFYWQHATGGIVPSGVGQVILVNSTAVIVTGQTLSYTSTGVLAAYSSDLLIHNNHISNSSGFGISLEVAWNNTISNNVFTNNNRWGIFLSLSSTNNTIRWNEFIGNNPTGTSQAYDVGTNNIFAYNYWNEWTEPDSNRDGLVDLPYSIDGVANNQDLSPRTLSMPDSANGLADQILNTLVLLVLILGAIGISIWRQRRG